MRKKIVITGDVQIGEIINIKGRGVEKVIRDFFFDSNELTFRDKMMTLKKAAKKSGKEYKLLAVLQAINKM